MHKNISPPSYSIYTSAGTDDKFEGKVKSWMQGFKGVNWSITIIKNSKLLSLLYLREHILFTQRHIKYLYDRKPIWYIKYLCLCRVLVLKSYHTLCFVSFIFYLCISKSSDALLIRYHGAGSEGSSLLQQDESSRRRQKRGHYFRWQSAEIHSPLNGPHYPLCFFLFFIWSPPLKSRYNISEVLSTQKSFCIIFLFKTIFHYSIVLLVFRNDMCRWSLASLYCASKRIYAWNTLH